MLVGSDGVSSKSARIGVGFGLFLSDSESNCFFIGFESDNFASDRIEFASNSDYTAIPKRDAITYKTIREERERVDN